MENTGVLIIGAGPAGLATAGRLRQMEEDFILLEKSNRIADSWERHYERLHLHTIKRFSGLPHYPLPDSFPEYVPRERLISYYKDYAGRFDIKPLFGEEVSELHPLGEKWVATTQNGRKFQADSVVICTGFNRVPNIPEFEGQGSFPGEIVHSSVYKNADDLKGKKVLVVGMGNSGAEIALDLAEQKVDATISVRGPVNIVPRDINGRPTQVTAKILGKLPNPIGDWVGRMVQRLVIGDLSSYGLHRPKITPGKQLRAFAKTPVLDIGTVEKIRSGELKVKPGIERISESSIHFSDGSQQDFDHIILATGYHTGISEFVPNASALLNEQGNPKGPIHEETHPHLYFVGFDAYSSGILESIYRDSRRVVANIIKCSRGSR